MLIDALVYGALLPFAVALVVLVLARKPWRQGAAESGGWAGACALGGGWLAGCVGVLGWPSFPPTERVGWLAYLALAAVALGLFEEIGALPGPLRWPPRAVVWGTALPLLLLPLVRNSWTFSQSAAWLAALGAAGLAGWAGLDFLAERVPDAPVRLTFAALPLTLLVVTIASAAALLLSGTALLTQLAGVLAAALAAAVLDAYHRALPLPLRSAVPVVAMLLPGLWILGYFYAELPAASALLLACVLPVLALAQVLLFPRLHRWQAVVAYGLLVLVPTGLAVLLASRASPGDTF